jgi:predicted RNase H-like HicB family nuclease
MKFHIRIEYDGKNYVGLCTNLIGCYAQSDTEDGIKQSIQDAISLYILNYEQRYEPFNPEPDIPQLNYHIKFKKISSEELSNILEKLNYNLDINTKNFLLFRKLDFPFYRIIIPNCDELSPIIIKKIFGDKNTTQISSIINKDNIQYHHG